MALDAVFKMLSRERKYQQRRLDKETRPHIRTLIQHDIDDIDDAHQVLLAERLRRNAEARKEGK